MVLLRLGLDSLDSRRRAIQNIAAASDDYDDDDAMLCDADDDNYRDSLSLALTVFNMCADNENFTQNQKPLRAHLVWIWNLLHTRVDSITTTTITIRILDDDN